jgi:Flp pilus assembly protein TadG
LPRTFPFRSSTTPPTIWYCSGLHRIATQLHLRFAPAIWEDPSGAIAVIMALGLTMLIGIVGLAVDVGMWYHSSRAQQNAADAAAIAASQNGTASYQSEAKAVAAQYGFVDGSNGITVTALNNQTCPSPSTATDCYKVTVAQASAPLFFSSVLGLTAPAISSAAMVSSKETHSYCMLALNTTGTAITTNGSPSANLNGCSIMSNSGAKCDGSNLRTAPNGPTYGDAAGTNSGCGINQYSNVPTVADPYASLQSSIPTNPCGTAKTSFPQEPKKGAMSGNNAWGAASVTTTVPLTSPPTIANHGIVCGDLQLQGDVQVTSSSGLAGALLVIENGVLDTNGHKLSTASGSALTIIFTGPTVAGLSPSHYPTDNGGSGTLDFMAPTSGTWKGIALYQDPTLMSGLNFSYAGNSPTWDISGAVYFPNASVGFSGAINKSSNGASCLLFVIGNVTINGQAAIEQTTASSCLSAGVTLPTNNVGGIALVM